MPNRIKVLWFSPVPLRARTGNAFGGGWVSALESAVASRSDIELGVSFLHPFSHGKERHGNVTYYPMQRPQSSFCRVGRFFRIAAQDKIELDLCKRVVDDFRPDIIQVFGTESSFGLISRETDIPVVIHLQGLMGPYMNAWVPPGYRMWDYVTRGSRNPLRIALGLRALAFNRHAAERELEIMHSCKAFLGRTDWDHAFVSLHAPGARYFSCWEALRPCFYEPGVWTPPATPVFVSTISGPLYKGHDMILKTARMLKESGLFGFEWRVYGVGDIRFAERKTGIRAADVGVRSAGVATAEKLRAALLSCSVYVHPSYIDNSPNSVCEAQVLGVPVVATNVGGVASLFSADRSCCLIPANDPLMAADRIKKALTDPNSFTSNRELCCLRHSPIQIANLLVSIWHQVAATGN